MVALGRPNIAACPNQHLFKSSCTGLCMSSFCLKQPYFGKNVGVTYWVYCIYNWGIMLQECGTFYGSFDAQNFVFKLVNTTASAHQERQNYYKLKKPTFYRAFTLTLYYRRCKNLWPTLSDVIPDVELQVFHTFVHLSSELLLFTLIDHCHHWETKPSRQT